MTKIIDWKCKYRLLEYDYNELKEKLAENMALFTKILSPMLRKAGHDPKKYIPDFKDVEFDNQRRNQYCGLRRGDLVDYCCFGLSFKNCIVVKYGFLDNNRIYLQTEDGEIFPAMAAECKIIKKIEE